MTLFWSSKIKSLKIKLSALLKSLSVQPANRPDMLPRNLKYLKLLPGLMLLLLLQSCASLSTMFYWSDTYLSWQIDDYFDLTSEQQKFVDQRLDVLLDQYKKQEIPKYIAFLQEIKDRSQNQLTESDLNWFWGQLDSFNTDISHLLVDDVVTFLSGLKESQLQHFEEKLAESNKDWLKEHEEREGRTEEERQKHLFENVEKWVGELTDQQKASILAMNNSGNSHKIWYDRRLQSQTEFLKIAKQGLARDDYKAALLDWYLNSEQRYTPAYQEFVRQRNERSNRMILMLSQTATDKQRSFFNDKVDEYVKELKEIRGK